MNVVIEGGRAIAVVPAIAGNTVIQIPELCSDELPSTGSRTTDLLLIGGAAALAGAAVTEASRRARRLRTQS